MPTRPRPLGVACAVLVSVPLLAGPAAAIPPGGAVSTKNGAKVKLHGTSVKAGKRIRVSGTKWTSKGSRVSGGAVVTVKIDDSTVLAIFPIRKQAFAGWVTIPRQVKAGRHTLRFLAAEPATSVKSKAFRVTR